jgi:hypothetical protein
MKKPLSLLSLVALATLATARPASAEDIERPRASDLSLSFGVPSGGNDFAAGAAGVWYMLSDQMNLGLNFGTAVQFNQPESWDFLLAPAVRYYLTTGDRIAPFVLGQANLRLFENAAGDADLAFSLVAGLGAEVWLIDELSLAGYVGLGADLYQGEGSDVAFGTLTSGLTANFYFDMIGGGR